MLARASQLAGAGGPPTADVADATARDARDESSPAPGRSACTPSRQSGHARPRRLTLYTPSLSAAKAEGEGPRHGRAGSICTKVSTKYAKYAPHAPAFQSRMMAAAALIIMRYHDIGQVYGLRAARVAARVRVARAVTPYARVELGTVDILYIYILYVRVVSACCLFFFFLLLYIYSKNAHDRPQGPLRPRGRAQTTEHC